MKSVLVVVALLLVVVFTGCDEDGNLIGDDNREEAQLTENFAWTVDGVDILNLSNVNGVVVIRAADTDSIRAEVTSICRADTEEEAEDHLADITFDHGMNGDTLEMETDFPNDNDYDYSVEFEITIPSTVDLAVSTANGVIEIYGMDSALDMSAANGTIHCEMASVHPSHDLSASAANGTIFVQIPDDSDVDFDLGVANGTASVTGFSDITFTQNTDTRKIGTIGVGNTSVTLSAANGTVQLDAD
jgi:uncharacterized lipoprotein YehR (DUF1307 family)